MPVEHVSQLAAGATRLSGQQAYTPLAQRLAVPGDLFPSHGCVVRQMVRSVQRHHVAEQLDLKTRQLASLPRVPRDEIPVYFRPLRVRLCSAG